MKNEVLLCDADYIVIMDWDVDMNATGFKELHHAQEELERRKTEENGFTHYLLEVKQSVNIEQSIERKNTAYGHIRGNKVLCKTCGSNKVKYETIRDWQGQAKKYRIILCNNCGYSG